jgi:hypothetical protein
VRARNTRNTQEMTTAIELIRKNFNAKKAIETKSDLQICERCKNESWWQPIGRDDWLCETCEPPSRESFVRDRRGPSVVYIVEETLLASSVPRCDACGGQWTLETAWSDGRVDERCWTCQASVQEH